jgi:DNA-binding response OmpR family regulator
MAVPRILIVDDEAHIVRALTYVFEREGFEVRSCADGLSCLELAREHPPDVILLDALLPGLDGHATLVKLREDPTLDQTAVVLLTARSRVPDIVAGLELGAADYITKPFDPKEVLARVRAQIRILELQKQLLDAERWRVLLETVGAVAHEMSQPLTAMMGYLGLMIESTAPSSPESVRLARIYQNGERAVELLRKLQRIEVYRTKAYPGTEGILDIERSAGTPQE